MVATLNQRQSPLNLVVTGEAEEWLPALEMIVGPQLLQPHRVRDDRELIDVVQSGEADAAVLDDEAQWATDILRVLRMVRRINAMLPVVVVTSHRERRWLEDALRLAVFSVVTKPLQLEELLRQIRRMMVRLDEMLREGPGS